MPDPTKLPNDRTWASNVPADIAHKLNYWAENLRGRGLHAEGTLMYEAATEIMALRGELGAAPRTKALRSPTGEVCRPGDPH